jgi:hypothetical protein
MARSGYGVVILSESSFKTGPLIVKLRFACGMSAYLTDSSQLEAAAGKKSIILTSQMFLA